VVGGGRGEGGEREGEGREGRRREDFRYRLLEEERRGKRYIINFNCFF
jgi:hypothetical protein